MAASTLLNSWVLGKGTVAVQGRLRLQFSDLRTGSVEKE